MVIVTTKMIVVISKIVLVINSKLYLSNDKPYFGNDNSHLTTDNSNFTIVNDYFDNIIICCKNFQAQASRNTEPGRIGDHPCNNFIELCHWGCYSRSKSVILNY